MPTIPSASETLERGKASALAEAMRLIHTNAAQGSIALHSLPKPIATYVHDKLVDAGYRVERQDPMSNDPIVWVVRWA